MEYNPTYKPFGKQAVLIEWESIIDEKILNDILLFKEKIKNQKENLLSDLIVGYNSLTLKYKNELVDYSKEVNYLKSVYKTGFKLLKTKNYTWEIPVCYDVEFGIDLEEMSIKSKLSKEKLIQLHSEKTYSIFFIGFLPGFLYLGGLDEQLYFERKPNPRLKVLKGAVAIGGNQTGIYPSESAGGWNVLGKTPVDFFNINNEIPCFAKAGDGIKFKPITMKKFHQIEKEIATNKYSISKILQHD